MPAVLLPKKGDFGITDYEKMFCPDPQAEDIFDLRGINRDTGCIVVVRPDQYVAARAPAAGARGAVRLLRRDPGRRPGRDVVTTLGVVR